MDSYYKLCGHKNLCAYKSCGCTGLVRKLKEHETHREEVRDEICAFLVVARCQLVCE